MDLAQPEVLGLLVDLIGCDKAVRFTVTGASMRPFLSGGETVILRRVQPTKIRRGDLLLCRRAGQTRGPLLLHRVVSTRRRPGLPALIQTQGDALWTPDEPVTESDVLGKVSMVLVSAPTAKIIKLDTRRQRLCALLIALRQRSIWRIRLARAYIRRLCSQRGQTQPSRRDSVPRIETQKP